MSLNKLVSRKRIEHWQAIAILLAVYDIIAVNFSYFMALLLRFDFLFTAIPDRYLYSWARFAPVYTIFCIVILYVFRLYRSIWRFASYNEILRLLTACAITSVFHTVCITAFIQRMPISYYFAGSVLQFILLTVARFLYRLIVLLRRNTKGEGIKVMLIGAGNAGQMLLRDVKRMEHVNEKIVCIIDDNPNKWGRYIDGVPVVGGRESILENANKYKVKKIYLAIASATAEQRRDILNICQETDCEVKVLPSLSQLVRGEVSVSRMKPVSVEDLLGREVIQPEMKEVFDFISGKVVLVTGGGGSIGSELCRQVANHRAKQLIVFDIYENNAYDIQNELKETHPELNLVTLIGSVRDSRRVFQVFEEYHPQIVYHAAAHKHVPLMEDSPCEAIKNNAIGTYKTAYAAMVHGCERFVLISTDKAVNPTNIMGASKRLCEMIIQTFDRKIKTGRPQDLPQLFTHEDESSGKEYSIPTPADIKTEFVAVRFGNVLGSNGSVVPIFKKQIAKGGPVTVTHPDIIRYFMTVPEAVRLVLLAGTYAKGGEIFVLDMGSPVKIDTLARNLIRLSGYKPDVDIKIEYVGLRPGEKLYEEKLMAEEGLTKTENDLIHIGRPIPFDVDMFISQLDNLMQAAYHNKKDIRERVAKVVNTYHPANPTITVVKDSRYVAITNDMEKT